MWDSIYRVIGRTALKEEEIPLVCEGRTLGGEESARALEEILNKDK